VPVEHQPPDAGADDEDDDTARNAAAEGEQDRGTGREGNDDPQQRGNCPREQATAQNSSHKVDYFPDDVGPFGQLEPLQGFDIGSFRQVVERPGGGLRQAEGE
jgi:hypothetical protein